MHRTVFFCELHQVTIEGRLGRLWTSNLYLVAERLQSLLLPEHCGKGARQAIGFKCGLLNMVRNIHGTLPRTCT